MITVRVPGDKSLSHRALMLAPLARGTSRVQGLAVGADVEATARAMHALGAPLPDWEQGRLEVEGPIRLRSPVTPIDCGNSGTSARLLVGLLAGQPLTAVLQGDASLRRRPMSRVTDPLVAAGARVTWLTDVGHLPLEVSGGELVDINHRSPVASAQVKSALLLAGIGAGVGVEVSEPGPSRDHTEKLLSAMGLDVETELRADGSLIRLRPGAAPLRPLAMTIPGDFSSAAFWLGLAVLGGSGAGVRVEGVGLNPRRTALLEVLSTMGGEVASRVEGEVAGEAVGYVEARPAELAGMTIPGEWVPRLLDELPLLACLAARARGTTVVRGAAELRKKESDRISAICGNLRGLGADVEELEDGFSISGPAVSLAGRVRTEGDHRIAMAFAVLGAIEGNEIEIDDRECVRVSYPGFWFELERLKRAAER